MQTLHSQQNYLNMKYGNNPEMLTMLKDVDVYLTVPLKLFEFPVNPYYINATQIEEILNRIEAEQMDTSSLFSENCKVIDCSDLNLAGIMMKIQILYSD